MTDTKHATPVCLCNRGHQPVIFKLKCIPEATPGRVEVVDGNSLSVTTHFSKVSKYMWNYCNLPVYV